MKQTKRQAKIFRFIGNKGGAGVLFVSIQRHFRCAKCKHRNLKTFYVDNFRQKLSSTTRSYYSRGLNSERSVFPFAIVQRGRGPPAAFTVAINVTQAFESPSNTQEMLPGRFIHIQDKPGWRGPQHLAHDFAELHALCIVKHGSTLWMWFAERETPTLHKSLPPVVRRPESCLFPPGRFWDNCFSCSRLIERDPLFFVVNPASGSSFDPSSVTPSESGSSKRLVSICRSRCRAVRSL
jgi:hypothetical protein